MHKSRFTHNPSTAWVLVGAAFVGVVFLTSWKMDAALRRSDRSRVLISAARYGDMHMVKTLLNQGVDTTLKDGKGKTALAYAEEDGHRDIVALLQRDTGR